MTSSKDNLGLYIRLGMVTASVILAIGVGLAVNSALAAPSADSAGFLYGGSDADRALEFDPFGDYMATISMEPRSAASTGGGRVVTKVGGGTIHIPNRPSIRSPYRPPLY